MSELKPGAVIVDLLDNSVQGDLDHCAKEDLLESARALLSLLPQVKHKGLWGLGKAYDTDCYIYTTNRHYKEPGELSLEIGWSTHRAFHLIVLHSSRADYWKSNGYSKLVGSIHEGEVTDNTEDMPDHYVPRPAPTVPTPKGKVRAGGPRPKVERPKLF